MNLHDAIAEFNDIVFDTEGFAKTVEYWPLGVEANKFEVAAIVDWGQVTRGNEKGTEQSKTDASIMIPSTILEVVIGKDFFCLVNPKSGDSVKMVAVAVGDGDEGAQVVTLRRIDQRELSRPGYRR